MKAAEVHRIMRSRFVPFLLEHGFKRLRTSACERVTDVGRIHIAYGLFVGCWEGVGGELEIEARANPTGTHRWINVSVFSIMNAAAKDRYRREVSRRIRKIVGQTELSELGASLLENRRAEFEAELERLSQDQSYFPNFPYLDEEDIRLWCQLIVPTLPQCIDQLQNQLTKMPG